MVDGDYDDTLRDINPSDRFEPGTMKTPVQSAQTQKLTLIEKTKGFILNPNETFRKIKGEDVGDGLIYLLVWLLIYGALSVIVSVIILDTSSSSSLYSSPIFGYSSFFSGYPSSISGSTTNIGFVGGLSFVLVIVFGFVGVFLSGLWIHLWVYVFGGRKGIPQTIKTVIYGQTPSWLFGWIPFVNFFIWIWTLYLYVVGIRELHEISTGKAVAAIIVAIIIPIAITVAIAATVYVYVSGMMPS